MRDLHWGGSQGWTRQTLIPGPTSPRRRPVRPWLPVVVGFGAGSAVWLLLRWVGVLS
jgi:hypothetical protein